MLTFLKSFGVKQKIYIAERDHIETLRWDDLM